MSRLEQRERRRRNSVLDDKHNIQGLPSEEKSAVDRPKKKDAKDCESVLDGPACIEGVPETDKQH